MMLRQGFLPYLMLVLAAQALVLVSAQEAATAQVTEDEVVYTLEGEALEGPQQLQTGYHIITLQNNGEGEGSADVMLVRITGDATIEDIVAGFQAVDQAFMGGGDPVAAINEVLEMGELWGGPASDTGAASSVGIDLPEGRYAVVATVHGGEHHEGEEAAPPAPPMYATVALEVTAGEETTEAPQADVRVPMVDFAFALPADIQAGAQTWEVVNQGQQIHHLVLMKLQEGKTMEDVQRFMETQEGEPPADEVGHTNVLSPGASNYIDVDLTPGTYLALCFMPDHLGDATGQPHVMLGMMQNFTVAGE